MRFNQPRCNPQHLNIVWQALSAQYNLCSAAPFKPSSTPAPVSRERTLVYIAKRLTQDIVDSRQLREEPTLSTTARLYQYLNWTIRLSKLSGFLQILESRSGRRILLINSELHCRHTHEVLFMLCVPNDFESVKSQKWQFVRLVTARDIRQFARCPLPRGVRADSYQFEAHRFGELATKAQLLSSRIAPHQYGQLKGVQTQKNRQREQESRKVLTLTASEVRQAVHCALQSADPRHSLISTVSILSGKQSAQPQGDFNVDQVLPVQVGDGRDWIGVVFRRGLPQVTLIDAYDICNKAILCDPSFDATRLDFFVCRYNKVRIEPDAVAQSQSPSMAAPWDETPDPVEISYSPVCSSASASPTLPAMSRPTSVSNMSVMSLASASASPSLSPVSLSPVSMNALAAIPTLPALPGDFRFVPCTSAALTDVSATIQHHAAQANYFAQFLPQPAVFRGVSI